ncbi:LysR family transcriptional regulator [Marinobacterium jannaschii]|uniref:LysR family transcriptional regulator n=1 Tax=Marinobacterium jannaschii TaxID=64970 RepID=UPI00055D2381|nr:LysR family transcriptional regulator [Marinobacterium jannaschii]
MHNLSIRHLRAFIEVAHCGSFTRAAAQLHVTQSGLTATIKQLEQQVGLVLFDRTTRRVYLSDAGRRFRPVAERLLSDFDTAIHDLQAIASEQQGKVAIAASPSMVSRLLPQIVSQYHQRHPGVSLYLRDDSASMIEQLVLNNEVDFGIAGNHSDRADLSYQPLLNDRFGVVLPEKHALQHNPGNGLNWSDLRGQVLVYLSSDTGIRSQLTRLEEEIAFSITSAKLEASSPAGVAALIKAGLGISILPALAASTDPFQPLTFIPLQQPVIQRQIYIISRKGRSLSPAAGSMLQLTRQSLAAAELPPWVTVCEPADDDAATV